MATVRWEYKDEPAAEQEKSLFNGINELTLPGIAPMTTGGFFLRDEANQLLGGISFIALHGGLYIDQLWVAEQLRGEGYGGQLLEKAEAEGRRRGCRFANLQTMDWEAPDFYKKNGYQVEHVRSGYDGGHQMILLRKELI